MKIPTLITLFCLCCYSFLSAQVTMTCHKPDTCDLTDNDQRFWNQPYYQGKLTCEKGACIEDAVIVYALPAPAQSITNAIHSSCAYNIDAHIGLPPSTTIRPLRDDNPLNGVTSLDLALIQKHILNKPLSSPYKMIAADANKSGFITLLDVVTLQGLILGIYEEFPNNTSWRFIHKPYVFPNPQNPFAQPFPESVTLQAVLGQNASLDFIGVKIGDVTGSAQCNTLSNAPADDRTERTAFLSATDRRVLPGDVFEVTLRSTEALVAQQFTLAYPDLELLEIKPGTPDMDLSHFGHFPQRNLLTHAWGISEQNDATTALTLRFRALSSGVLSQMLRLSDEITASMAYNSLEESGKRQLALRFGAENQPETLELYQNQPNPFVEATEIGFYWPQAERATLTIWDETGKTLLRREGYFESGHNTFTVSGADLPAGALFYQISGDTSGIATKKMLKGR